MYMIPYTRRSNSSMMDLFDELERSMFGESGRRTPVFSTDIRDEGAHYLLQADLPGFRKEDIHIDIDDDILTIKAEHTESKDNSGDKGASKDKDSYIRRERYYGAYTRSFNVSEIDVESIKAAYENGVLTLTMPKKAPVKPESKHLEIE